MALALPELPVEYRYPVPSALLDEPSGQRLRLATSGGPNANPRFFTGRLLRAVVASDLLLTLGDVARARFYVPPRMLQRILELADPVATCADDRLRFEAFSACASVYGRVDLEPGSYDGEVVGRGTTNVDLGADLRAALAAVQAQDELGLSIGATEIEVRTGQGSAVERRVPLPQRWLRSFLEVQAVAVELAPFADLDARAARALVRSLPRTASRRPVWLMAAGRDVRVVHHDPGSGAPRLSGLERVRLLERVARHASSLRIYASEDGTTGWEARVPGARLTLLLSPEAWRGFSGEGRTLTRSAGAAAPASVAAVRAALGWQAGIDAAALTATTGLSRDVIEGALAALAISGIVGYDLAEGCFFRRELPFDLERVERFQPRLRDARRLVARTAVRIESDAAEEVSAWVSGAGGVEYRVRSGSEGWSCTCPWYGQHRGRRGPCKHVLAVQIEVADEPR